MRDLKLVGTTRIPIRALTEQEQELIQPEVRLYMEGQRAEERLGRMIALMDPTAMLDLQTMTLFREEPVTEGATEPDGAHAAS